MSELLGILVEPYNPRNLEEFAEILKTETGKIVIVGHSNTTPTLAALLSGTAVDSIDESEYENLYQVVSINRKTQLNRFKIFPINSMDPVGAKATGLTSSESGSSVIQIKEK